MIRLPEWFHVWLRKQPDDFDADILIKIRKGEVTTFTRTDFWNQRIFEQRYKEERPKEGPAHVRTTPGPGAVNGRQGQ